jgi:hypothetical protein
MHPTSSAPSAVPYRSHHGSWLAAPLANANHSNSSVLSILEPGVCTGGMLTYGDHVDESDHGYQQDENHNKIVEISEPTSFVAAPAPNSSVAPELPSQWPSRSAS